VAILARSTFDRDPDLAVGSAGAPPPRDLPRRNRAASRSHDHGWRVRGMNQERELATDHCVPCRGDVPRMDRASVRIGSVGDSRGIRG